MHAIFGLYTYLSEMLQIGLVREEDGRDWSVFLQVLESLVGKVERTLVGDGIDDNARVRPLYVLRGKRRVPLKRILHYNQS